MVKNIYINTILVVLILGSNVYGKILSSEGYEYIPIYGYQEIIKNKKVKFITAIDTVILIKKGSSIHEKAELIARTVSNRFFDSLEINVSSIDSITGELCLKIDLIENDNFKPTTRPSWYQFFQGSAGGAWTSEILISNFLQKQYEGSWIDKIKFYYRGEEIGEWEHIWLGEHIRYNFDKN